MRVALIAVLSALAAEGARADDVLSDVQQQQILLEARQAYDRGLSLVRTDRQAARDAFGTAAQRFRQLIDNDVSNGRLQYNLANAYFQGGELGRAILHYREARRYLPRDPTVLHNLEYARSLRRSQIAPSGRQALSAALLGWQRRFTVRSRVSLFLVLYGLFWVVLAAHVLGPRPRWRRLAVAAAVGWVAVGASVAAQLTAEHRTPEGVVVVDDVVVRKGNSEGFEPQFAESLHQGVEFRVVEERPGWLHIRLPNDKSGWIRTEQAELIG